MSGLRWSFASYVLGTLAVSGLLSAGWDMAAKLVLVLAAVCFLVSIICAAVSCRENRGARFYLLLVGVMLVIALCCSHGVV